MKLAAILPDFQTQLDLRSGKTLLVTKLTLKSTSDTFTIPNTADNTNGNSIKQVLDTGDTTVTVTQSGNTVTLAGTAGSKVTLVSLHPMIHSFLEA